MKLHHISLQMRVLDNNDWLVAHQMKPWLNKHCLLLTNKVHRTNGKPDSKNGHKLSSLSDVLCLLSTQ